MIESVVMTVELSSLSGGVDELERSKQAFGNLYRRKLAGVRSPESVGPGEMDGTPSGACPVSVVLGSWLLALGEHGRI